MSFKGFELDQIHVTRTPSDEQESGVDKANRDELDLLRIGKRPVLKVCVTSGKRRATAYPLQRSFGFMSILGYSCTILITWEGVLL